MHMLVYMSTLQIASVIIYTLSLTAFPLFPNYYRSQKCGNPTLHNNPISYMLCTINVHFSVNTAMTNALLNDSHRKQPFMKLKMRLTFTDYVQRSPSKQQQSERVNQSGVTNKHLTCLHLWHKGVNTGIQITSFTNHTHLPRPLATAFLPSQC